MVSGMVRSMLVVIVLSMPGVSFAGENSQPKNVFIMISDGASFGTWDMADLYQYGVTMSSVYCGPEFDKCLMATNPLNTNTSPTGGNAREVFYDPCAAWDATPNGDSYGGYANYFEGYYFLKQDYTDSAAAATAMATGQKTYNGAINWGNDPAVTGSIITPSMPEVAKAAGKAVGTISSVQLSHATPAGFSDAHNITRNDYVAIANQMLDGDVMDVVMGAGNPQYDNDGHLVYANYDDPGITDTTAKYVGGRTTWIALNEGVHASGWTLIQDKADFQAMADGTYGPLPNRVLGVPMVGTTFQQSRSGGSSSDPAYDDPNNAGVPTLATVTRAAINALVAKSETLGDRGFFLHIEGGAVDWAAHGNQCSRIIEEQIAFNDAVEVVCHWIEANGGWQENLLIVTTDHGNAMPMGPDSDTVFMDRIEMADVTGSPAVRWHFGSHTNELVPVFSRGNGSGVLAEQVVGHDPYFATYYPDWAAAGFTGDYLDNTDLFTAMNEAAFCPSADINGDCHVDLSDFIDVVSQWLTGAN